MLFDKEKEFEYVCMLTASLNVNITKSLENNVLKGREKLDLYTACERNVVAAMHQLKQIEKELDLYEEEKDQFVIHQKPIGSF